MATTETFISENELQTRFRIEQSYKPDFGKFVAIRWLYSIGATGGKNWQRVLFYLLFTLTLSPLALVIDLLGILAYGLLLVVKKFLDGIFAAVLAICQKALGTAAIIAAAIGTILIIYFKWHVITDFVKGLF